ncbi:MAG TPA: hypothetical protein VK801_04855 [Caulobacteraceae bacterium]|jgi:hypothetical protein|nr:hypothetical protein [Caulobacteraceae bacterium]
MRFLTNKVLGTAVIAASLAASATAASAYVACNHAGECWHVSDRYDYPAGAGVMIHDDGWVFDRTAHYHWAKDRPGRGYWDHGHWRRF